MKPDEGTPPDEVPANVLSGERDIKAPALTLPDTHRLYERLQMVVMTPIEGVPDASVPAAPRPAISRCTRQTFLRERGQAARLAAMCFAANDGADYLLSPSRRQPRPTPIWASVPQGRTSFTYAKASITGLTIHALKSWTRLLGIRGASGMAIGRVGRLDI